MTSLKCGKPGCAHEWQAASPPVGRDELCPACGYVNSWWLASRRYSGTYQIKHEAPVTVPATTKDGKAGGLKFDSDKPRPTLLMQGCNRAIQGVIAVLTFGAKKYAADSWKQVENGRDRYRDAMYRHLAAIESGEVLDPESGLPHWDHVCCNVLFLSELNKE